MHEMSIKKEKKKILANNLIGLITFLCVLNTESFHGFLNKVINSSNTSKIQLSVVNTWLSKCIIHGKYKKFHNTS